MEKMKEEKIKKKKMKNSKKKITFNSEKQSKKNKLQEINKSIRTIKELI